MTTTLNRLKQPLAPSWASTLQKKAKTFSLLKRAQYIITTVVELYVKNEIINYKTNKMKKGKVVDIYQSNVLNRY